MSIILVCGWVVDLARCVDGMLEHLFDGGETLQLFFGGDDVWDFRGRRSVVDVVGVRRWFIGIGRICLGFFLRGYLAWAGRENIDALITVNIDQRANPVNLHLALGTARD